MRTLKSFFLIALLALSFSLHADNEKPEPRFQVRTEITNHTEMGFLLSNLQQITTTVKITSVDGKKTYYEATIHKHNGYSGKLHMHRLRDGRYLFEVEQGATTKKQVILIRDKKIVLSGFTD
jgi:hypothetical protein